VDKQGGEDLEQERELLESLINQAVNDESLLYSEAIVMQSQKLDQYIVAFYKESR
jgi:hypothetical protein